MLLANSDLKDFKLKTLNNVHFCLSILVMPNGYYFGQSELRYRMSANKYVFQNQSGSNGGYFVNISKRISPDRVYPNWQWWYSKRKAHWFWFAIRIRLAQ